ncbi:hypothetical protein ILUMI_06357 [Ignelater luminosus]|uniref:Uncharacterized protein n=1 Tax=Ignelater luminosus TaxID=2038154 RepID=A0A8K0D5X4_IGNLU|nr:hypothetical protein ILUMI_06357 [Ignelater luminosus]
MAFPNERKLSIKLVLEEPLLCSIDHKKRTMLQLLHGCLTKRINFKTILGIFLFASGVTFLILKVWIWETIAAAILILKPNSVAAGPWLQSPEPVPTDIYIFNWTNPEEFLNHSTKPKFEEVGPYKYMLTTEKTNRNASDTFEGVFNMANGVNGNFDILNWNYQNTTPYYDGSCARVHGSGGELFSRKLTKTTIGIFAADLCRFVPFDFEDEVYVNGILGYRYMAKKTFLDNG